MDRVHPESIRGEPQARVSHVPHPHSTGCVGRDPDSWGRTSDDGCPPAHPGGGGRSAELQSASVPAHGPNRNDDAGDDEGHAEDADPGEERGLSVLREQQSEVFRQKVSVESQMLHATVDTDFNFMPTETDSTFTRKIQCQIILFQAELDEVITRHKNRKMNLPKLDLLAVMCSDRSELVSQVVAAGGKAQRFGLAEGDLQTTLVFQAPENVWCSPECGPWGKFSNLNMGKSLTGFQQILEKRFSSVWQISLASVLFRHQTKRSKHFHMEQPDGSYMQHTLSCGFDLCRVGSHEDPETALPMRKRLHVRSTSGAFQRCLHGMMYLQEHAHRQIAGSIRVGEGRVNLSSFTETIHESLGNK